MTINVQGSLDVPRIAGLEDNEDCLIRIACAQVLPSSNSDRGDLDKLALYATEAAKRGADVVIFPEYFLSGATHDAWKSIQSQASQTQTTTGQYLEHIAEIARDNDIDIVAGTIVERGGDHVPHRAEEDENVNEDEAKEATDEHDGKVFNTVYYVNRTGQVAGRYTKRRLWHPERSVLSPGHELRHDAPRTFMIKTKKGKELRAGIGVCWDLAFPETFREMLDLPAEDATAKTPRSQCQLVGPDIVFAPTCWYATDSGQKGLRWNQEGEAALLDSICLARAIENECIVAMTNVAGPRFPQDASEISKLDDSSAIGVGRSCICAPFVGCAGRLVHGDEGLLLACIDTRALQDARDVYKQRHDLYLAWSSDKEVSR